MLDELRIRNLGVIEDAAVTLDPGLTVLTGETGAGKTLVVTALQLLLGARGDASLVRTGADAAVIEARWIPAPPGVQAWRRAEADDDEGDDEAAAEDEDDQDGPGIDDDDETVVQRTIRANGRSRVRIDGDLATVGALSESLGPTVEVHAQDSHRRLLEPAMQRRLLDDWAGPAHRAAVTAHAAAHASHEDAVARRDRVVATATERARELDRLAFEMAEIDAVGLTEDDRDLDQQIDELVHADDLRSGLGHAADQLGAEGAGDGLGEAVTALRRLPTATDATRDLQARLDEVVALADDLAHDLRHAAEAIDADPHALDRAQSRLAAINGLTRKYGPGFDDVQAFRAEASRRHAELDGEDQDAAVLDERVAATDRARVETAATVTTGRRAAAEGLEVAVSAHLADLGLEHARFLVEVRPGSMGPTGADDVRWLLAANPGQEPAGLAAGASGGERSRVALALEVALADVTDAQLLVFDEVDAGIGGATAMQVGAKLAMLARSGRQVVCVTHLAQLAAWADGHWTVDKVMADGATTTVVEPVSADGRVAELARMLGGDTTEAARAHAAELLDDAVTGGRRRSTAGATNG